jgi:hypothetical protein
MVEAGHLANIEAEAAFTAAVVAFLRNLPARPQKPAPRSRRAGAARTVGPARKRRATKAPRKAAKKKTAARKATRKPARKPARQAAKKARRKTR